MSTISLPWDEYIDLEVANNELINQFSVNRNFKRLLDNDKAILDTVLLCAGGFAGGSDVFAKYDLSNVSLSSYPNSAVISETFSGSGSDFVVEYHVAPDRRWYRKYKSGWVEQGGLATGLIRDSYRDVVFLTPFHGQVCNTTATFRKNHSKYSGWQYPNQNAAAVSKVLLTGMTVYNCIDDIAIESGTIDIYWSACGF